MPRICSVEGCGKRAEKRGWCSMHYRRWREHGDPGPAAPQREPQSQDGDCIIDGCQRPKHSRGWCVNHYKRWHHRGGDPAQNLRPDLGLPVMDRFWAKVDKDGPVPQCRPDLGPCWIWTGTLARDFGYGLFYFAPVKPLAHRASYELLVGPVPEGLELDHLCRTPRCVNPGHLEPVTHAINMARGAHALKTHCPRGHEYGAENTYIDPTRGSRHCRACRRLLRPRQAAVRRRQQERELASAVRPANRTDLPELS